MSTPNNITVGHAAVYPSTAMIPTTPECGAPCAEFEALAHTNAKLREELESVRTGSAKVCRELRADLAECQIGRQQASTSATSAIAENAALRNSHAAIYLALGNNEADHIKWPQQIAALREEIARLKKDLAAHHEIEEQIAQERTDLRADVDVGLLKEVELQTEIARHVRERSEERAAFQALRTQRDELEREIARLEPCEVDGFDGQARTVTFKFYLMPCVAVGEHWEARAAIDAAKGGAK